VEAASSRLLEIGLCEAAGCRFLEIGHFWSAQARLRFGRRDASRRQKAATRRRTPRLHPAAANRGFVPRFTGEAPLSQVSSQQPATIAGSGARKSNLQGGRVKPTLRVESVRSASETLVWFRLCIQYTANATSEKSCERPEECPILRKRQEAASTLRAQCLAGVLNKIS